MALQDVRAAFAKVPLNGEARAMVDGIIDAALARGGMTHEEREKLFAILAIEDELGEVERSATEEAIRAFEEYQDEVDTIAEQGVAELEDLEKGASAVAAS